MEMEIILNQNMIISAKDNQLSAKIKIIGLTLKLRKDHKQLHFKQKNKKLSMMFLFNKCSFGYVKDVFVLKM